MRYMIKETLISWKDYACGANSQIYSYLTKTYLKGSVGEKGYVLVTLKCIDGKFRTFRWHRVIWTFFYGTIPEGMEINHLDENKENNALSNLSLCTHKENTNYGTRTERQAAKLKGVPKSEEWKEKIRGRKRPDIIKIFGKRVIAYNDDGKIVHEFESMREAEKHGFNHQLISRCCRTGGKHKGLHWEKI